MQSLPSSMSTRHQHRKLMAKKAAPPATRQNWLREFTDFCALLRIDSKDIMPAEGESGVPLNLYGAQERYLTELCRGLDDGIRFFVCLKARQLGISTVSLAIDL